MRYFKNRAAAGRMLAEKIRIKPEDNPVVVSLSEGGILVGAEIAKRFHTSLLLLTTKDIHLPMEPEAIASMSAAGTFTYDSKLSAGELEELTAEFRSVIDQERLQTFQKLNRIVGKDGIFDIEQLKKHVVILVSDGLNSGLSLDVASDFMKPIKVKKLIAAVPISSVPAIDRLHLLADEIYCLGAVENYLSTDHYYEENQIPDHKTVVEIMKNIVLNW
jgi:putative phosphoribosyl transferase